jgi:TonB family protein
MQSGSVRPFGLLEYAPTQRGRQWGAFGVGIVAQGLGLGLVVVLGILFPSALETVLQKPPVYIDLVPPPKQEARAPIPPRPVWKTEVPRLSLPPVQAPLAPPLRSVPRLEQPKVQAPAPPKVDVVFPSAPAPGDPKLKSPPLKVGVFEGSSEVATLKLPAREVQTGGFGSPNGLPGDAEGGNPGNVVKLGSFGLPSGPGYGNGTGGTHGARGTVASAGFGNGIAVAGGGGNRQGAGTRGVVRSSGFDAKPAPQASLTPRPAPEKPALTPVEILSKPNPVYTEAARKLGLQGEIVLSVVFTASGRLQVVRVVEGLGYGLDEAACRAAEAIRFKPAQRDGQPVDFPATLRVVFQLAGSSTKSGEPS